MSDLFEISVLDNIAPNLCVSKPFDVLIIILFEDIENLSTFPEKVILNHASKMNRTKVINQAVHKVKWAEEIIVAIRR